MLDRTILAEDSWIIGRTNYKENQENTTEVLVQGTIFDAFQKLKELVSDGGEFSEPEMGEVMFLSRENYYRRIGKSSENLWTCTHKGKWGVFHP